jgi:alpha-D-ribose 1-methylphosphonate 5-triphosphate diphosphatase
MTEIVIEGGQSLIGDALTETSLHIADGRIADIQGGRAAPARLDARGLLVLPGIVDLHGDAFERQMMPRPGVDFPVDVALADTDRQVIANGITTVFHGITWSWEPGLRGTENAHALVGAIEQSRPHLAADTRIHLRHETFNLDAEETIIRWLAEGRIDLLAFNDHMGMIADAAKPQKRIRMAERTGLSLEDFDRLVERIAGRADDVPASIARLAAASSACGLPMLSHDDATPEQRRGFRALGIRIAEFPVNEATAREAAEAGEFTVFGAPNVVRGGSHTGWIGATDMVRKGLCSILASDYYYPAPLLAAFRLVAEDVLPLPKAWDLISRNPAMAAGLPERGRIAAGCRADIILVDATHGLRPRVVAVIVAGRIVYLGDANRLSLSAAASRTVVAA